MRNKEEKQAISHSRVLADGHQWVKASLFNLAIPKATLCICEQTQETNKDKHQPIEHEDQSCPEIDIGLLLRLRAKMCVIFTFVSTHALCISNRVVLKSQPL